MEATGTTVQKPKGRRCVGYFAGWAQRRPRVISRRRCSAHCSRDASSTVGQKPETATGVNESAVALFPSWPYAFAPQQRTARCDTTAQVWDPPAAMAVTAVIPVAATGARHGLSSRCPTGRCCLTPSSAPCRLRDTHRCDASLPRRQSRSTSLRPSGG